MNDQLPFGTSVDNLQRLGDIAKRAAKNKKRKVVVVGDPDWTQPEVGMGVTGGAGSDCYPYTVVEVLSDKHCVIQSDSYRRTDKNGLSECQEYEITPNPNGAKIHITFRNNGRWVPRGQDKNRSGYSLGFRRAYQDPHF